MVYLLLDTNHIIVCLKNNDHTNWHFCSYLVCAGVLLMSQEWAKAIGFDLTISVFFLMNSVAKTPRPLALPILMANNGVRMHSWLSKGSNDSMVCMFKN